MQLHDVIIYVTYAPCAYPQNYHRSNSPYPHCLFTMTLILTQFYDDL